VWCVVGSAVTLHNLAEPRAACEAVDQTQRRDHISSGATAVIRTSGIHSLEDISLANVPGYKNNVFGMCSDITEIPAGGRRPICQSDCVDLSVGRHLDDKSGLESDTIYKCLLCLLSFQTSDYAYLPCIRATRALAFVGKLIPHIATKLPPLCEINTRRTSTLLPCAV
jgi:hypothetical protein